MWTPPEPARTGDQHLQVFIPSVDQDGRPIPGGQESWTRECLRVLADLFGGATAFPPGLGAWRDDHGDIVFDDTVVVFSYVASDALDGDSGQRLFAFLSRLGRETNQGEVGLLLGGSYYGIQDYGEEAS